MRLPTLRAVAVTEAHVADAELLDALIDCAHGRIVSYGRGGRLPAGAVERMRVVRARGSQESATVFLPAVRPLLTLAADLEDESTADRVIEAAIEAYGQIDILVCNAGVGWQYGEEHPGTMGAIHEASLENWRDIIGGVDLEGYFTMIHAALPHIRQHG